MQSSVGKKRLCILCLTHPRGWTQNVTRKSFFDLRGTKSSEEIKTLVTPVFNSRVSWAKASPAMMDEKIRRSESSLFTSCVESFFRILVVCKLEREQKQSIVDFWVLPSPILVQQDFALFSLYQAYSLFFGHTPPQSPPRHNVILPTARDHFSCLQWRHEFFFISLFWDPNQLVVILCCR